jgi:hypothetical protein
MARRVTSQSVERSAARWSDFSLVVRAGKEVFVIPKTALDAYASKGLSAARSKNALDEFFSSHQEQKADAALVRVMHISDGDES